VVIERPARVIEPGAMLRRGRNPPQASSRHASVVEEEREERIKSTVDIGSSRRCGTQSHARHCISR
jgi:hypothetical protein